MNRKSLFIGLFLIIACTMIISGYQLYKGNWYLNNYKAVGLKNLEAKIKKIIRKEDVKLSFYNEMEEFLKNNPAYKAIFFIKKGDKEGVKEEIAWSIPWRLEGMLINNNFVEEIKRLMNGGVYSTLYLNSFQFAKDEYEVAKKLLPSVSLHQVIKEKSAILESYPFYQESKLVFFSSLIAYWLLLTIYIFNDARKHKRHAFIWGFIVLFTNLLGVSMYYLLQVDSKKKCSKCATRINNSFVICPYCGERLKDVCPQCGHVLEHSWDFCPECGEKVVVR